ncbi:MAG: PEGA domain-containing protein [Calditrichaeota bacterium]|nr:PEGA domain-containing protein [Calditrichota bacterium]
MKRVIFLLAILSVSCGVKQPTSVENSQKYGSIFATSGNVSAQIFLDGESTSKMTPDTLFNVEVGPHTVAVRRDGYRAEPDSVVVEVKENQIVQAQFALIALSNTGYVVLKSTPANAPIFVDGNPTGQSTPDTLTLETGSHQIEIRKNGYLTSAHFFTIAPDEWNSINDTLTIEQRILLEGFANVSCTPCVAATNNLHRFNEETHSMPFVIMEYYVNWPSPNDPFYLVSPDQINERVRYYSITGVPALQIDGAAAQDLNDYNEIISQFDQAGSSHNSEYGISIDRRLMESRLLVSVEIFSFSGNFSDEAQKLFVAVIENDIHFDSPPGSNGLKDFSFVFRKFLSSEKGDEIAADTNIANYHYELDWPDWQYERCQVVAFIQNRSTKQIIQTSVN